MSPTKCFLCSLALAFSIILNACGGAGAPSTEQVANTGTNNQPTTSDFFHLAIVPDQAVSATTFEVQVIAENIDPNRAPTPPTVVDANGNSFTMSLVTLKWPGTADDSVQVYSRTIQLLPDRINNIRVTSGTKEIPFAIKHKTAISVRTATNASETISYIKAAIADPSIDVVEIDYDEPDLGNLLHDIGSGIANNRTSWLTVQPSANGSASWVRDSGAATRRPKVDFLHLKQVVFGSDTSDGGGGHFYTEIFHRIWVSQIQFRAKYKSSWPKIDKLTANYLTDIRVDEREGQRVYLTDCLWDGTAPIAATSGVQLARDLRFNSHRGDFNNFGKVFLNVLAQDVAPIRNAADTDYLHNDGFQIWGSPAATNLVFKGFKVVSPNVQAELQPFHLGQTFTPNFSNIFIDKLIIDNPNPASPLVAQIAGRIADSRISNLVFPGQSLTIRQDFPTAQYPNGAFSPTNVQVHNLDIKSLLYIGATSSTTYNYSTVTNTADISSLLNANAALSGAVFSRIKIAPGP